MTRAAEPLAVLGYTAALAALLYGAAHAPAVAITAPSDGLPTAIPYSQADRACAIQNAYLDAGTDPASQQAVVHVVVNRARDGRWPGTLCGVVYQGGTARNACQFSWYCDGKREAMTFAPILEKSTAAVVAVLDDGAADPTHGATCYHRKDVRPQWARTLKPTAHIGVHVFYRC